MVRTSNTIYEDTDSDYDDCGMVACGELALTTDGSYPGHRSTTGFGLEYDSREGRGPEDYKVLVVYSRDLILWEL